MSSTTISDLPGHLLQQIAAALPFTERYDSVLGPACSAHTGCVELHVSLSERSYCLNHTLTSSTNELLHRKPSLAGALP